MSELVSVLDLGVLDLEHVVSHDEESLSCVVLLYGGVGEVLGSDVLDEFEISGGKHLEIKVLIIV